MSDPKGKTSNEDVKVTKTTGWSLDASRKAIIKLVDKWRIAREIPDDFVKKHLETFISVLYQAQVKDMDTAKVLLDGLKQDLVGGSQTSDNKLWGFKEGAYAILCSNKCLLSSVLIRNILKLTALSKTPVTWSDKDLIENSDQNNFWSGFFSELYSVGPLKRITPITNKTSMYATGVACMRYEIYNLIRKDSKQIGSQYWYPVDTSVSGDPIKKTKKYLSIFLGTYAGSALLSKLITQCLIRYHATYKEQIGKRVVFASFLKDAKATVALFNRYKVEKEKGKGKKGKTTERRVIIKPTKPSRLATILAVERASIAELTESAWSNLEQLIVDFDKTQPLLRNYDSFAKRAKELIEQQWDAKQKVLNASKFRQGALDLPKDAKTATKILEMRKLTSTIEIPSKEILKDFETLYVTLFTKFSIKNSEGYIVTDLESFSSTPLMKKSYPITSKLVTDFLEIKSSLKRSVEGKVDDSINLDK